MIAERVLADAGLTGVRTSPLGGGTYNSVWRVSAREGEFVLKLAPGGRPGLTYERGLMRTEALFCALGSAVAPVPEVVLTDHASFLLTTCLPGEPLSGRSDVDRPEVRRRLGAAVRSVHEITGPGFGYPQLGLHPTWTGAFFSMVDAVRADAVRHGVALPSPDLRKHAAAFDEVRRPALVHFDLWDGNVLVRDGLTGLVDGERAFWGDPVAEFVSLALFGTIEDDRDLLAGYGFELTDSARLRLAAYQVYLYSIMLTERVPRGTTGDAAESAITGALNRALGVLA
ncbi:Predicted kinase, aminoglycoside phosphotransferase (APT) family [Lentzea xinjiangensis]|uniref:Predicted kinase, aminoglycoside phosphotransferase (APT) family n=1 Tax=Lentzea xinjiangensis TaxID=402600 RepID=A0A1H9WJK1_9PSEU|nr:aminoglycoside phosphotransferase family protein [Lentzea xinjiangensis]SES33919.1 Predicted kinase, aminoglycoside phosphotransferase (APT) family [Lentzea xinjiangensis]